MVGARIYKTGIAVTITMYICKILHLEPSFFGAIAAVVNMQPSIFLTIKTARGQVMAHIWGVAAGLIVGYIFGGNAISMGLITILIIWLYIKLDMQSGISMGVLAAVFILSSSQEQFLNHALNRSAVIFAGMSSAMFVNIVLWPPRYMQDFKVKLKETNEEVVNYFCRAVNEYVNTEDDEPDLAWEQKEKVHKLNKETRTLLALVRQEGEVWSSGISGQGKWVNLAEQFIDYNQTVTEKADRIYSLLPERLERRQKAGSSPISSEFKAVLAVLASGCVAINRVNDKLRSVIIDGKEVELEEISEEYWDALTKTIEIWQQKLTSSYYLHALIEAAVTANEIKWAARMAKKLLNVAGTKLKR